jgi:signal transduction histidine kinase
VTYTVEAQITLFWTALYLLLIFAILAYFLSLLFVKSSLKTLNQLVAFAKNLHLDHLDQKISLEGPDDDEIKILADTLNISLSKLHQQTFALKDFVAHASHELKTPLMAMSSELDLAIKTKDISLLQKVKSYLKSMNSLIEQLLFITRLEDNVKLKLEQVKLDEVLFKIIEMMQKKYADKHLDWQIESSDISLPCHLPSLEMIVQNLLDNAAKYSFD